MNTPSDEGWTNGAGGLAATGRVVLFWGGAGGLPLARSIPPHNYCIDGECGGFFINSSRRDHFVRFVGSLDLEPGACTSCPSASTSAMRPEVDHCVDRCEHNKQREANRFVIQLGQAETSTLSCWASCSCMTVV